MRLDSSSCWPSVRASPDGFSISVTRPVCRFQPLGLPDVGLVPSTSMRFRVVPVWSVPSTVTTPVHFVSTSPAISSEPPRAELIPEAAALAQFTALALLSIVPKPNRSAWSLMSFADFTTAPAETTIRLSERRFASESTLSIGITLPANVSVREVRA